MQRSLASAVAAALLAVLFAGCNKPAQNAEPQKPASQSEAPVAVRLGKVEMRAMPKIVTLLGNVVADRQSEVAANVAGRVLLAPIERGQKVKVGEALLMVDSKAANFSASAAAAQAELADTQFVQAREDCARAERLFSQGAIGQAEYDRQHTQCKAQELQASAARAQAGLSSKLAADAVVRAPFTGFIGERYVNVGEYVQPQTRVASMYSVDPVRVVISVPERGVSLVKNGVNLDVRVSAYPDRLFPATVEYVSPALRTLQRDLLVEAKAPNPDGALRPGMFATIEASLGDEQVATVPADAIVSEGDVRRLFLARDGHAFELVVRTGITRDERTVVYEDLPAETLVVRAPPAALHDGTPLAVDAASAHAAATPASAPSKAQD